MKEIVHFSADDLLLDLPDLPREELLGLFATAVAQRSPATGRGELLKLFLDRESLGSTGIGDGVAIPHCISDALESPVMLFGRSRPGVDFQAADGKPVHLFFVLAVPAGDAAIHLMLLSRISRLVKNPAVRQKLLTGERAEDLVSVILDQGDVRCQP